MIICTFIGHDKIYDVNVKKEVRAVLTKLVNTHNKIECIINYDNAFSNACKEEIIALQKEYEQNIITLTIIDDKPMYSNDNNIKYVKPLCSAKVSSINIRWHNLEWAIRKSSCVITYIYSGLEKSADKSLNIASKYKIEHLDVSSEDTLLIIPTLYANLDKRGKEIIECRKKGMLIKEIALIQRISKSRVTQIEEATLRHLRSFLYSKVNNTNN